MNFEKLELYGFKSFADKTPIKFEEGITGIVGPNGCGKSNVADAIKWVLGEQSAKNLRGSSMQDVIFNGTEARKSLSYCEVSLFFNNVDKHLFNVEYDQVIITRKLFRSGESEYFLNKESCRLRDIIDLLHQCGIGKNGYTVIGQNKVTQIMNSKPEDRRAVFEEATGIAKNKSQKAESEKRLERVKEELRRYSDIIAEIESNLKTTERKAEKTREYNILAEQLKLNEINSYIYKRDTVDSEKKRITDNITKLSNKIDNIQNELDNIVVENNECFTKLSNNDSELSRANQKLIDANVVIEQKNGEVKVLKTKIEFIDQQISLAQNDIDENNGFIDTYQKTISFNKQNIAELENDIYEIKNKVESLKTSLAEIDGKIRLGDDKNSKIQQLMFDSLSNLSDMNLNMGSLSGELNGLVSRKQELEDKLTSLNEKKQNTVKELQNTENAIELCEKNITETNENVNAKEQLIRALNSKSSELNNKIFTCNNDITAMTTKRNMLNSIKDRYEGYQFAVKRLMTDANNNQVLKGKIKGVVASLVRTDKQYEVAVETALGGAVQNVVTATPDDAKFLIEYLKKTGGGRLTFLPVTSMKQRADNSNMAQALKERGAMGRAIDLVKFDKEYFNVFSNLLGNTLIAENADSAVYISKKYNFSFKIVTLDGDLYSTQGSMTGGSRKNEGAGLLSNDRELAELNEKLEKATELVKTMNAERQNALNELNKQSDLLSESNDKYSDYKQEQITLSGKKNSLETVLEDVEKEIESYVNVKNHVDERYEKVKGELEKIAGGTDKLVSEKDTAKLEAEKSKTEIENDKKKRDELSAEISNINITFNSKLTEKENLTNENSRLFNEIERLNGDNKTCEMNINNLKLAKGEANKQLSSVVISEEDKAMLEAINKEINTINLSKQKLNDKIKELEERRQNLLQEQNNLKEKKTGEEISYEQVEADVKYLEGKVQENYMLDYDGALAYKVDNFDIKESTALIRELTEKIRNLGNIDAGAIEEFEELNERYQMMLAQKQDIEKADSDLREGIDTLRAEILKTFNEGFKIINENFSKIFKELFGGGKAMLELDYTDCEDPLEAGVEIRAEPPGKKLQKISLLSGGEQALTTIAILFAILKYKPMPFCVLDEIEAALDDANVGRFANYLKKFSKETQFIVITHRKPTMELVDSLFGVTMEEKGVSKTVSIKLADAANYDVQ